jgi:hypothetical protein
MNIEFIQRFYELNPAKKHYLYSIALVYPYEQFENEDISLSEYLFNQLPLKLTESFQM